MRRAAPPIFEATRYTHWHHGLRLSVQTMWGPYLARLGRLISHSVDFIRLDAVIDLLPNLLPFWSTPSGRTGSSRGQAPLAGVIICAPRPILAESVPAEPEAERMPRGGIKQF